MSFLSIINREYFLPKTRKIRLILSAGFGFVIFLMLMLFSPFGFHNIKSFSEKIIIALGYGFIAFLVWFLGLISIKLLKSNKGKLWQILIALLIIQFFSGVFNMIYNNIVFKNPSYFEFFLQFQFVVCMMGIIPSAYLILFIETNYYLKIVTGNSEKLKDVNKLITFHDQNPEKSLMVKSNDIIYIQSQDNYIKVEWKNSEDKVITSMIRATLNSAISALSGYDSIIQCHRSYLINLNHVENVKGNALSKRCILLYSESTIPIARPKIQLVLDRLNSKD
ncbi:LytTR family DNA-binding domain-containing protein [Saccharicrinis sp. FJH2]|uniref:LytTR family DNA-binding domain-containing protein n=1 Tax=Saccharicrinis sp. FJH65 TaxID=3344659 RepID=UPI0035F24318